MGSRIVMGSGNGVGRRQDVTKLAPMIGAARLVRAYTTTQRLKDNRRTTLEGGGSAFAGVRQAVVRHPFAAGFGGTLLAIGHSRGQTVRQG